MFETLFKYPRVLARHREGPVADARERFLNHCAEQGLARAGLRISEALALMRTFYEGTIDLVPLRG